MTFPETKIIRLSERLILEQQNENQQPVEQPFRQFGAVAGCIQAMRIDSYQKLRFVLFLDQHPEIKGTSQEFAERLHLGNTLLLEEILADLQKASLIDQVEDSYRLNDEPGIRSTLRSLAKAFEDPLVRQEILDQVKYGPSLPAHDGQEGTYNLIWTR